MFGPSLLVAPVYKYRARTREVYFPAACGWYDFYSGKHIKGGQQANVDAPYERIPLFVREGTILPVGPDIQYTDEKPADTITLFIYTGKDCTITLYEDEGINYNYEKGSFSTIKFSYNDNKGELTIGDRNGEFDGMLKNRTFNIVWVTDNKAVPFNAGITPDERVEYEGNSIIVNRQ